jgi:transposase
MGRRRFSPEFKVEAVKLVTEQHRSLSAAAAELGIPASTLSSWVQRGPVDTAAAALGEKERLELAALRRENRVLRMERDILKRAAVFFAKENA